MRRLWIFSWKHLSGNARQSVGAGVGAGAGVCPNRHMENANRNVEFIGFILWTACFLVEGSRRSDTHIHAARSA